MINEWERGRQHATSKKKRERERKKDEDSYKCITDRKEDQINKRPYCLLYSLFVVSMQMDVVPSKRKTTVKMWQDQWDLFASYLYLWVCIGARQIHYWDSALRNGSIWLVFRNFFLCFGFSFSCCCAVALWFANLPCGVNLNCLKQIPLKPLFPFKLTLQICCAWISTHFENSMKINLFKMNCSLMK